MHAFTALRNWHVSTALKHCSVDSRIQDFEPEDAGIYKCYVSHRYPVSTPNGMAAGTYAPAFEVGVATGSIWIKEIKPDSARLPIGTPEVRDITDY